MFFLSYKIPDWFSPAVPEDANFKINHCFSIIFDYQMISLDFSKQDETDLILLQLTFKQALLFFFHLDDPSSVRLGKQFTIRP